MTRQRLRLRRWWRPNLWPLLLVAAVILAWAVVQHIYVAYL